MDEKFSIVCLMVDCLLYKIKPNVRMVCLDWSDDYGKLKLYSYLEGPANPDDSDLMEDAIALFTSYGNNYEKEFELDVVSTDEPFNKLYTGKFILFARKED